MLLGLMVPALVALGILALASMAHRRLPVPVAARFMVAAVMLASAAVLPAAVLVALAFLTHVPVIGIGVEWCAQAMGLHGSVPPWLGLPTVAVLVVGCWRAGRLMRDRRALRCDHGSPMYLVDSDDAFAATLPGAAGRIVVSTALWSALDDRERQVVLAHERAHARYRHDRFVLVAELVAALLPPLRWLSSRLTFTVERWADEVAARQCGDRELVALTLGKVALASSTAGPMNFAGVGVAGRMRELLEPPRRRPRRCQVLALWALLTAAGVATLIHWHHLEHLALVLCPH